MRKISPLVIGDLIAKYPVIQGGMGVGISLSSLAGAVAKAGGIGIISTAQIGFRDPDFLKDPMGANMRAIGTEFEKARAIAPDGIIGFNIMVATKNFAQYVKEAVKAGADLIISGAGLPVDLPGYLEEAKRIAGETMRTKLAPIVSTAKSAMVICKMWDRKYKKAPDLVVIEGPLAGGHLGFSREQLEKDMAAYSEGQKKKVLLAASLASRAHLYIWDEPMNYIDVLSRIQLEELILAYQPTLLFVEHDREFCERIATRQINL